jgi:IS5 family transposase
MRKIVHKQLVIVQPHFEHEHALELQTISDLLEEVPQTTELVHKDLIRGLLDPEAGRNGMTAEQVLRALVVKQMNDFSYEELAFHLADSRSYRNFCRLGIGDGAPSKSALQRDIKKLKPETLEAINRILMGLAQKKGIEKGRKSRIDCTVVESNIHHPLDSSLLYDCVRVLCRLAQRAKESFDIDVAVSNHTRRAKRRALGILNARSDKKRNKLYRDLLKVTRKTVGEAERVVRSLRRMKGADLTAALGIIAEFEIFIPRVFQVVSQAERRVLNGEMPPPEEKIVSIFEAHTDIIRKDRRDTYYGHKVVISGGASGMVTDMMIVKGNPADSSLAVPMVERHEEIFGCLPKQASMDGGFASKPNLSDIKAKGVEDVAFSKKRGLKISEMAKSAWVYKRLRDFRAGVEGIISFLKRCFGLGRCIWRGFESFKSYAWSSVISANLLLMARHILS